MNRMTATILSLALAASAAWAGDPPSKEAPPLPAPVVKAEETLDAAVSKAYAAYLKSVDAEVKKAQAALEKEKQAATKAGNLELALAIKAKQDALTVDAVVAEAEKKIDADELLGGAAKVDVAKVIVGTWKGTTAKFKNGLVFSINKDKTASWNNGVGTGNWTQKGNVITVTWKTGYIYTIEVNGDKITFKETNRIGEVSDTGEMSRSE